MRAGWGRRGRSRAAGALAAAVAAAALLGATAGAADAARGDLVSVTNVARLSPKQVSHVVRRWKEEGKLRLDTSTVRYGVDAYRLVYETVDTDGVTPRKASGLVVIPRTKRRHLRVVAWEHGTTIFKGDAPSTGADADARLISYLFSGSGFIAVAPDYLGLGVGPGSHPYNQRSSELTASVDMLRAARAFVAGKGRAWDGHILVSGFSQGAKVAVALGGALQGGADPGLSVGRLAAVAGPYDLQGAQIPNRDKLDPIGVSFSLAYTAVAWKSLYGLYQTPNQVFPAPYDRTMEKLFDGHHTQQQVFAALRPPKAMFTAAFLTLATHPTGAMLAGVQGSDGACRYAPTFPVRLYAARTDDQVAFANSQHCRSDFRAHGVGVPLLDVGKHGHFGSEIIAVPRIVHWFRRA
jgi:hypothetical protein